MKATSRVLLAVAFGAVLAASPRVLAGEQPSEVVRVVHYSFGGPGGTEQPAAELVSILFVDERTQNSQMLLRTPDGEKFSLVREANLKEGVESVTLLHEDIGWWAAIEVDNGLRNLPSSTSKEYFSTLARRLREEDPLIEIVVQTMDGSYWRSQGPASDPEDPLTLFRSEETSWLGAVPEESRKGLRFLARITLDEFPLGGDYFRILAGALLGETDTAEFETAERSTPSRADLAEFLREFASLRASERRLAMEQVNKLPSD